MDAKTNAGFGMDAGDHQLAVENEATRVTLAAVLSAVTDGACWLFSDGRLLPLNPQWYRLHGCDPDDEFPADVSAYEKQFSASASCRGEVTHPLRRALARQPVHQIQYGLSAQDTDEPRALVWSSVTLPGTESHCILVRPVDAAGPQQPGNGLLEGLKGINAALASKHDLRQLVQMVTDAGTHLSGAEFGAFFYNVTDTEGDGHMLYTIAGPRASEFAQLLKPRLPDIFGVTFRGPGIRRRGDVAKDPSFVRNPDARGLPQGPGAVRSYLAAPVISNSSEVLGGLFLGHSAPNVFDQAAEEAIGALAAQAAIAIDHSRAAQALEHSEERVRRRLAELTAVYDTAPVGLALVTPDLCFARVNARMAGMTGIAMPDHLGKAVREVLPDLAEVLEDHYARVLASGEPILDVELPRTDGISHLRDVWLASFHPVRTHEQVLLGVNTVLQDISARKHGEARLRLQHETTRTLASSESLDAAATAILRSLVDELDIPFASLWLVDQERGHLRCVQAVARSRSDCMEEFRAAALTGRFQIGQGIAGAVWQQKRPVWVQDLTDQPEIAPVPDATACGLASGAGIPVMSGDSLLGVIGFYSESPAPRSPLLEDLLLSIGSQIGQFIKHSEAKHALLRSEERLLFALEAANLGTWEWNKATGEVHWSANMESIHGMEPGTFGNSFQSFLENVHPDDRDHVLATIQRALQEMSRYRVEYRINEPDQERWVEGKGHVLVDGHGTPIGMTGVCSNITERKQSEELFRLAVEASPSAIVMLDTEGRIALANKQLTRLFGYKRDSLLGESIERLLPDDGHGAHPVMRALADGGAARAGVETTELVGMDNRGHALPVSVSLNPVSIGSQHYVLCAFTDNRERKRAEENIRRVNEQLWRKNQEMEQFVYSVSHDLKSPLVTVTGFVGMLKEDLSAGNADGAADAVERIERATRRMSSLINDLLQLSRIGRVEIDRQTVSLEEVIGDLQQDLVDQFRTRQARLEVHGPLPEISADRARVIEVFDNLLSNALKYGCPSPGTTVTVGAVRGAEEIRIYVRDQGPGIPTAYQGKIFQAFQRLSNQTEGTGVGLAIVEKIMRTHGGRVWVESEEGNGARFWLAFPERPG